MLVYCDSVILIYYLDAADPFQQIASRRLGQIRAANGFLATSDLSRLECRIKPIRNQDAPTLARFDHFFSAVNVTMLQLTTAAVDLATEIRAKHNFRTTDALHLASAVLAGCDLFLTNDRRLARFTDVPVEIVA